MVFGSSMPDQVACTGQLAPTGVDAEESIALTWDGKGSASLMVTALANTPEEVLVMCSKGYIKFRTPAHCPTQMVIAELIDRGKFAEEVISFDLPKASAQVPVNFPNSEGFLYEVQE